MALRLARAQIQHRTPTQIKSRDVRQRQALDLANRGKRVGGSEPKTTLQRLLTAAGSRPVIGSNLISGGPEWMELCGNAGVDSVCVDQMVSAMSWQETSEMLRGAAAGKTSGWVRLSAYPWGGNDQRAFLRRDVLKAIAIGAEAILASVDTTEDTAALVEMPQAHVRHRKYAARGRDADGIVPAGLPSIIPLVESDNALANLPVHLHCRARSGFHGYRRSGAPERR